MTEIPEVVGIFGVMHASTPCWKGKPIVTEISDDAFDDMEQA